MVDDAKSAERPGLVKALLGHMTYRYGLRAGEVHRLKWDQR